MGTGLSTNNRAFSNDVLHMMTTSIKKYILHTTTCHRVYSEMLFITTIYVRMPQFLYKPQLAERNILDLYADDVAHKR